MHPVGRLQDLPRLPGACPVPDKAITITAAEVVAPGGATIKLGRPEVVAERCIGCGVCENVCPVAHRAAIEVYATRPSA